MTDRNRWFVIAILGLIVMIGVAACASATPAPTPTPTPTPAPTPEPARPSNEGGPGPAVDLKGDATAGAKVFVDNCQKCHGDKGAGGINNVGSTDGTFPPLAPIDETLVNSDLKVYVTNLDLFIEHGSAPEGEATAQKMPAWGDDKKLTAQQIADVIAYIISLNP
jgi:mono/diheme cytochrome c family protein